MNVAIVGATGLVGMQMVRSLEERSFPVENLYLVASNSSEGKIITFKGVEHEVITAKKALEADIDIALFSAGGSVALEQAPKFVERGAVVIDNSSAFRMDNGVPLVVPEVNGHVLSSSDTIVANPNCSTIQLVMVIQPLQEKYGLKRVVISTYQSVTGTGKEAVDQMMDERLGKEANRVYPHPIDLNILPHIDVFQDNGYTKEEMKMVNESRKIMGLPELRITATAVRIPVIGGHGESVNIELEHDFELEDIRLLMQQTSGVVLEDEPSENRYPMPVNSHGRDEVFVGRIRRDESQPNTLNLWIVADNLRKGAATNAIQIAEIFAREIKSS